MVNKTINVSFADSEKSKGAVDAHIHKKYGHFIVYNGTLHKKQDSPTLPLLASLTRAPPEAMSQVLPWEVVPGASASPPGR